MRDEPDLAVVARLFKVLSNESRLELLRLLHAQPQTVGALETATGMSQTLVSQHLRKLREAGLARVVRHGREATYSVADVHITCVIEVALGQGHETCPAGADIAEGPAGSALARATPAVLHQELVG